MTNEQLSLVEEPNRLHLAAQGETRTPEVHYPDRSSAAAEDQGWGQREVTPRRELNQRGLTAARQALGEAVEAKPEHWRNAA